jgi:hypothetical protein
MWSAGPDIPSVGGVPYTLADAPAVLLPNGNILFAASPSNWPATNSFPAPVHFFEFTASNIIAPPVADTPNAANDASFYLNFLLLPTGQVLVTDFSSTIEIYTPSGTFQSAWQPVISSVPSALSPGGTYQISGSQFNGLSQGAAYGDDNQSATNYPLVRITNNATGHVFFAKTFNHSTMSIAPNAVSSTNFKVPAAIENGASSLVVVANGIPSQPVSVTIGTPPLTLEATPATDIVFSGPQGGPFSPPSFQYQLSSSTGSVNFTIAGLPSWLGASFTSGTATTAPMTVTFTVNVGANGLASGLYGPTTISFTNTTNGQGNTTRNASLTVNPRACEAVASLPHFTNDGRNDVLLQNSSGAVGVWLMNGGSIMSAAVVGTPPAGWRLVGTSDLNGDKNSDLLWRHTSGATGVWFMNGTMFVSAANIATVGTDWHVIGGGDLDGDGKGDILLRHDSGAVGVWFMNGASIVSTATIATVDPAWRLIGVGDFNGDGKTDFLWRHDSGAVGIWLMNGASIQSAGGVASVANEWHVVAIGDMDGDGKSDILLRHDSGTVGVWLMNGIAIKSASAIATVGTDWHLVAAGDLNGDGKNDILWRHDSGAVGYWLMNGTTFLSAGGIAMPDNTWHIVGGEHDRPVVPIAPGPC